MAAEIHLEEAILSVYVPLSQKQVFGIVGVDVRYAVGVAQHIDPTFESGHHQPARSLGE